MRPPVSIVIPSLNQAEFLEEAITSVLGQANGKVETIVMDGGSTDDSVAIVEKYSDHLSYWQSKPDGGQAAAINAGFGRASGEILGWLNSDDFLLPGALQHVVNRLDPAKREIITGNCFHFRENSSDSRGSNIEECFQLRDLRLSGYLLQPSTFWTRETWEETGPLDESLGFTFDWDWFIRASKRSEIQTTPRYLSAYRFHEGHKTGTGGQARRKEIHEIYRRHSTPEIAAIAEKWESPGAMPEKLEHILARFRLRKLRPTLLRTFFPQLYGNLTLSEIAQIREQVRS